MPVRTTTRRPASTTTRFAASTTTRRPAQRRGRLTAPLAVCALALATLSGCSADEPSVAADAPPEPEAQLSAAPTQDAPTTPPVVDGAPGVPMSLTLGDGPARELAALGVDADGFIDPPAQVVQWYDRSPRPGEPGIAVIAGHVSYDGVPDAFADLAEVEEGERVTVTDEAGTTREYEVTEVRSADKDDVMVDPDVWGPSQTSRLAIVSCDDTSFLEDGVHYSGNVVVEAQIVDR